MIALGDLNPYYTALRYPDQDSPKVQNPAEVIGKIGELLEWIEKQLEE